MSPLPRRHDFKVPGLFIPPIAISDTDPIICDIWHVFARLAGAGLKPNQRVAPHAGKVFLPAIAGVAVYPRMATREGILLSVWCESLVENLKIVTLADDTYRVRTTAKQKLKQADFQIEGRDLRGLEQNPNRKSLWAGMARNGAKVMQFLEHGRYVAVVADGKAEVGPSSDLKGQPGRFSSPDAPTILDRASVEKGSGLRVVSAIRNLTWPPAPFAQGQGSRRWPLTNRNALMPF